MQAKKKTRGKRGKPHRFFGWRKRTVGGADTKTTAQPKNRHLPPLSPQSEEGEDVAEFKEFLQLRSQIQKHKKEQPERAELEHVLKIWKAEVQRAQKQAAFALPNEELSRCPASHRRTRGHSVRRATLPQKLTVRRRQISIRSVVWSFWTLPPPNYGRRACQGCTAPSAQ